VQKHNEAGREKYASKERSDKRHTNKKSPQSSLFQGLLVCPDCECKICLLSKKQLATSGTIAAYYDCRTYIQSGKALCSSHRITEAALKTIITSHIKELSQHLTLDESAILDRLKQKFLGDRKTTALDNTKERKRLEQHPHELELQLEQLFENKFEGAISPKEFATKAKAAETERTATESQLEIFKLTTQETDSKITDFNKWATLIREM